MKSTLAEASRRDLGRRVMQMTAEERLAAYVRHCQAIIELRDAGEAGRRRSSKDLVRDAR